jgi:DNA processing protein
MGCGLTNIYPPENTELVRRITDNGAIISELPMTYPILGENFPRRNRIISGLSLGVFVIEAGKRSGSLITARLALEQSKEVFALPGRIDSTYAAGTHRLIQRGAKLVMNLNDILESLDAVGAFVKEQFTPAGQEDEQEESLLFHDLSAPQQSILKALDEDGSPPDAIVATTGLPIGEVLSELTMLQLRGIVRQLPGGAFATKKSAS